ncbi:MAG: helix-turn-helix domain-containing protein, partial [Spirochaetota bacterium]
EAFAITAYAGMLMALKRFRRADTLFLRALLLHEQLRNEWGICQTYLTMGFSHLWQARFDDARSCLIRASEGFGSLGAQGEKCNALLPLFEAYYRSGRYDDARRIIGEISALSLQIHDNYILSVAAYNRMLVDIDMGDLEDAQRQARIAAAESFKRKDPYRRCITLTALGYLEIQKGNYDGAVRYLRDADALRSENRFLGYYTANLFPYYMIASLGAGDPLTKINLRSLYRRMLKDVSGWPAYFPLALRAAALYEERCGNLKKAVSLLGQSASAAERAGCGFEKACSEHERGRLLRLSGKPDEACTCLENACFFFTSAGADRNACRAIIELGKIAEAKNRYDALLSARSYHYLVSAGDLMREISDPRRLYAAALESCVRYTGGRRGILFFQRDDSLEPAAVFHPGDQAQLLALAKKGIKKGEPAAEKRDKVLSAAFPLTDAAGTAYGVVCIEDLPEKEYAAVDYECIGLICRTMMAYLERIRSVREIIDDIPGKKEGVPAAVEDKLREIISHIKGNYRDELSRESLSAKAGLNPDYMGKMFKLFTGKKVGDFLSDIRIQESMSLLKNDNMSIVAIAFDVGFESLRTFNRAFSAYTGMTPSAFREQKKG